VAIGIRLPGHGTVPGGLTHVDWEDWMAAVRLVMREAARRAGDNLPVHIVGYSNGGALALKYALDALNDSSLRRPDRIVLISPMIGVPPSAIRRARRLARGAAAVRRAAWLTIAPEYNPSSTTPSHQCRAPVGRLTTALQAEVAQRAGNGEPAPAPVLTFNRSRLTVVTAAVCRRLRFCRRTEPVLFDDRTMDVGPLLRSDARAPRRCCRTAA
jgi:pimeloyl-ACP methyl ester carboxylesterase